MRTYNSLLTARCSLPRLGVRRRSVAAGSVAVLFAALLSNATQAQSCAGVTNAFTTGTNAVAAQVNTNFTDLTNCINTLQSGGTFGTSLTVPLVIGGTGTTSTLSLRPTSGVGTTGADIKFQVGNNGATEAMRITNAGNVGIGMTPSNVLDISKSVNGGGARISLLNSNSGASATGSIIVDNGTSSGGIQHNGASFTTSGMSRQDGTVLYGTGAGGLTVVTTAAQPIYLGVNNAEVARVNAGNLTVSAPVIAQGFRTTSGVTASIASGAATTIGSALDHGAWIVDAYITNAGSANYAAMAMIVSDSVSGAGNARVAVNGNATLLTISVSGLNVQVTQSSGNSSPVAYSITRFSD